MGVAQKERWVAMEDFFILGTTIDKQQLPAKNMMFVHSNLITAVTEVL